MKPEECRRIKNLSKRIQQVNLRNQPKQYTIYEEILYV